MATMQTGASGGPVTVRFLGGVGTVTGSKHLIDADGRRVLLDCGLFQGLKELRLRNWGDPPVPPRELEAVVLSHAHLDHSGYLPILVRGGFDGPIYCSRATAALVPILLADGAGLMQEEAEYLNRHGLTKHKPALPLYTHADVRKVGRLLQPQRYHAPFEVAPGISATLQRAGHILGAASVHLRFGANGSSLLFSGDLGRWDRPILNDPEPAPDADVVLMESTYGDRLHTADSAAQLAQVVNQTAERRGALLIPAFAVGRTQELLYMLRQLEDEGRIPELDVFLDSPMALDVTELYVAHQEEHDLDMSRLVAAGRSPIAPARLHLVRSVEESKRLNDRRGPFILIAGSGMLTGGRILHHLRQRINDPCTTLLLVGYQAQGTRGRALLEGHKTLKLFKQELPIEAQVRKLDGLSAHADQGELLRWLRGDTKKDPPPHLYLVHGEPDAAAVLARVVEERLGWSVTVAEDGMVASVRPRR